MSNHDSKNSRVYSVYQGETLLVCNELTEVNFHGVPCLKATAIQVKKSDWRTGLTHYIPKESVTQIIEYDSLEQLRKILAEYYAQKATD